MRLMILMVECIPTGIRVWMLRRAECSELTGGIGGGGGIPLDQGNRFETLYTKSTISQNPIRRLMPQVEMAFSIH